MEGLQLSMFDLFLEKEPLPVINLVDEPSSSIQSVISTPNTFDILMKFDAVKIENISLISEEDREFCEGMQERLDAAVSLILKAKEFYQKNEMSNIFLSTKNLIKDLDEKLSEKIDIFKRKIVDHFRSTYLVTINSSIFRKYDHTISYKDVVDDILLQMDGMNFAEKAKDEIKTEVRETIYNTSKVKVQSVKVSIADYMYFEEWFGRFRNRKADKLKSLLRGIELFESGATVSRDTLKNITYNDISNCWFDEYSFSDMNKFDSFKCYKNGKIDLKFKNHEMAMLFARDYLKYT